MGVYATLESMINEMVSEVAKNQTIMKYIVYDDVLADPVLKPDVPDVQSYIYRSTSAEKADYRLYPLPKIPTITEDKKSMILCWVRPTQASDSIYFKDFILYFDIISHIDIWTIAGGIVRPLRIMDEINDIFAFKASEYSIGKLVPLEPDYKVYDSRGLYCGYRMAFKGTDFTKNMCGSR